ncbi:hypothetical protein AB1Y20_000437 [Prymnesium parvum]|uniref:Ribosomal protein eL8/eL30/eS12/Gadd45 domain-containing protein n=1 Tax=Prymnesium parvum TaxID=97485 RepID=A0AB34K5C3_PRYPA
MGKRQKTEALTLHELGGKASRKVSFLRTDATALIDAAPSNTKLKAALASPLEPQWPVVGKEDCEAVLQWLGELSSSTLQDGGAAGGMVMGLQAVTRSLRREELRAVVLARDSHAPILYAHIPLIAQLQTQRDPQRAVVVKRLPCSSAQLGQPFGLLRASVVGLRTAHFSSTHPFIQVLSKDCNRLFPWLEPSMAIHPSGRTENASGLVSAPTQSASE